MEITEISVVSTISRMATPSMPRKYDAPTSRPHSIRSWKGTVTPAANGACGSKRASTMTETTSEPSAARSAIERAAACEMRGMNRMMSAPSMGRNVITLRYGKVSTRILSGGDRVLR